MTGLRLSFLALVASLAISAPASAQDVVPTAPSTPVAPGPPTVAPRPAAMLADIEWLAGPHFDGRLTGSGGNAAVAEALAERLDELGGEPLPGAASLLQSYEQSVVRIVEQPRMSLSAPGATTEGFEAGTDFDILIREGTRIAGPLTARVVELTEENATREWISEHHDAALVIPAELFGALTRDNRLMQALFHPTESPAAVIIGMPDGMGAMPRSLFLTADDYPPVGPILMQMTHDATERLLAFVAASERREPEGHATVTVHGGYAVETATVTNVAAALPASGSRATEARSPATEAGPAVHDAPPIILSAHFDGPGRLADSWHYPGAIDNASGVAVVLELARMLAESGRSGPRPVWVVFFNGEEQGMRGSKAFVSAYGEHLPGACIINVDMAGLAGAPVSVTTTADAQEYGGRAAGWLDEVGLEARVSEGGGSDHATFAGLAPAVSLVQSPYRQMHRPTDSPENADARTLEAIASALFELVAGEVDAIDPPADDLD